MLNSPGTPITAPEYWTACSEDNSIYSTSLQKALLMEDHEEALRDNSQDIAEVLALLPSIPSNSTILELASGNGRLTPFLAKLASRVIACDVVEKFCQENRENCKLLNLENVEVVCENAMNLHIYEKFDLVFINWLLMYLSDEEVPQLLDSVASTLKPGGWLLFRESCRLSDEGMEHTWQTESLDYPAYYRSVKWYSEILSRCSVPGTLVRPVDILPLWTEPNQAAWLWQRADASNPQLQ